VTDPYGCILGFLDWMIQYKQMLSLVEWGNHSGLSLQTGNLKLKLRTHIMFSLPLQSNVRFGDTTTRNKNKHRDLSLRANYIDRRLSAKLVPIFAKTRRTQKRTLPVLTLIVFVLYVKWKKLL
jgi:hypothetical protein